MKIGIVSENYDNDSHALKSLLEKHTFRRKQKVIKVAFKPIARKIEGDQLLTKRAVRVINLDCDRHNIDLVILAKDLDDLPTSKVKINSFYNKIEQLANQTDPSILPFLMIFEQEALILADIQAFNKVYGTTSTYKKNPKFQSEPKEYLKQLTRSNKKQYKESDTPEIFKVLDFDTVRKNHNGENSFQSFIDKLEKEIKNK